MTKPQREYVVTLKDFKDLEEFYKDMETSGTKKSFVPEREIVCLAKRPISRNTNYLLTDQEARDLAKDPRILSIVPKIKKLSTKTPLYSEQTATWSRSDTISTGNKNWGLYRSQLENNILNWGSETGTQDQTSTIKFSSSGKNVDIIVVDNIIYPDHSEFNERVNSYDWFGQHDTTVRGTGTNITNVTRTSNLSTITTQSAHGLSAGAIINVICTSDNSFSAASVTITAVPTTTEFRYDNTGIDVSLTSATGYWVGVYQYDNYNLTNNHATAVAGVIAGNTQGWARDSNIYNLRHDVDGVEPGAYTPTEYIIDYIRAFHASKPINPETGRKNPTIVNNSWGVASDITGILNPYTGYQNPRFSEINFKNSIIKPTGTAVDTGISGVYTNSALVSNLVSVEPGSGNRIVTTGLTTGTVSSITFNEVGSASLIDLGAPTSYDDEGVSTADDAYWTLNLPFPITYLTQSYQNDIYVNSNSYVTFGAGSFSYFLGPQGPAYRKIFVSAGDRSAETIYGNVFGTAPNRTYTIRYEGYEGAYSSIYETTPTLVWEMTFYEASPEQIDLHVITNANFRAEFTSTELRDYGINLSQLSLPLRSDPIDQDISDAIDDGIIFVGAAGNNSTKIDVVGGDDYNNYFVDNGLPIYYHRGSSPGASHPDVICVGEVDSNSLETKSSSSNTGPRVDLYAPGEYIAAPVFDQTGLGGGAASDLHLTVDGGFAGAGSILAQAGRAAIVTAEEHGLTNGDVITIDNCSNTVYNVTNAVITVVDSNTVSFDITDTGYSSALEILTGTVKAGYLFQKWSGTSMACAQVTGLLALALEQYPWMNQTQAKEYILQYSQTGKMTDPGGGYTSNLSLQEGNNKFAYYHKERPDDGILLPKTTQWVRPATGQLFPRQQIRKK